MPDANIDAFAPGENGFVEEVGQRVDNEFWEQAHKADVPQRLTALAAPSYLVFGTADEYVSPENRDALISSSGPDDRVDVFTGYAHSAWTAEQADDIIDRSVSFLTQHLLLGDATGGGSCSARGPQV